MVRMYSNSLTTIATSYTLRCDAKYADDFLLRTEEQIRAGDYFEIGDFLPRPFVKGVQHLYLDVPQDDSVPIVNTLSIQNLTIRVPDCSHITRDDFGALSGDRVLRQDDILLTVDGGVSIGKPVLFDLAGDFSVDSHICILRPVGISPMGLVYLFACPFGQMQFRRWESGASGQTGVTEEDIRRFVFPARVLDRLDEVVQSLETERQRIAAERARLDEHERQMWDHLDDTLALTK